ncbi:FAD-dependent oxidoreductase [Streptomyces sp. SID13031]|uniref:FAD-dependent oxidoreductase n=1 Tax=Streptomyces sp. SID13031 TaxID=2706046 RepID=UPI0013CC33C6|nr:FAD-dependent oxidoreductase [Streptomyces sp. SID13031]NEA33801.1 FAD-dependent oxidoreductase [Streptomyces sp. SID13031]
MTYVIAGDCCSDASCVAVCPMNSIHPSPGAGGFGTTDGLFIDPRTCIDCGACADVCPVDAAKPADQATPVEVELNRSYFAERPALNALDLDTWEAPTFLPWTGGPRRVAVVGAGPAGMYAARELLLRSTAEVTVYDRLPVVGGLARFGVAPDHPMTKQIVETFTRVLEHPRVQWRPGTEAVVEELENRYDAVVHAVGSYQSRRLGIPGEDGAGSCSAADMVAWYNGRPGVTSLPVALTGPRAVIVGNGNVALDLARLLISDDRRLAGLDLPPVVRAALQDSGITEVVILGRRGPESAAYSASALRDLLALDGVEVVVDENTLDHSPALRAEPRSREGQGTGVSQSVEERGAEELLRGVCRGRVELGALPRPGRRIVLCFSTTPVAWDAAAGLTTDRGVVPAGNLFAAIGFVGQAVPGLPFDERRGIVPNDRGAVIGRPGHYVTGWIKRGAQGGIGANRACAEETVRSLLAAAPSPVLTAARM